MFGWSRGGGIPASLQQYTYDLYVDSNAAAGGDGSVFAPFDDIADAITAVNSAGNGTKLGVVRGSHFRKQLAFTNTLTGIEVRAVGAGERPIFDGSRIISAGAITAHASYANVYQVNVTVETETAPSGGANGSDTFHIALYEDDTLLAEQFASGTIDTNVQTVRDTPGSYTAHKVGSTTADPRTDTGGTQYTYYFHLTDSGDPRSNGAVMAYAEHAIVAMLGINAVWSGLEFRRSADKDMVGMASTTSFGRLVENCVFRDPGCHAAVIRATNIQNNFAYGRSDDRSVTVAGAGINCYWTNASEVSPPITLSNNYVQNFYAGYASHGSTSGAVHESLTFINNEAEDCGISYTFAGTTDGATIDGLTATNCGIGIATAFGDDSLVVSNFDYTSPESGNADAVWLNSDIEISDSSIEMRTSTNPRLYKNIYAQQQTSADRFSMLLNNVETIGAYAPTTNDYWLQVDLSGWPQDLLDAIAATPAAAWSLRRLAAAYDGPLIRVRRSSDNAEADIGATVIGHLDEASLLAHCGAGDGYIVTWYDQSGNGRHQTQATAGSQARIVASGVVDKANGRPIALTPDSTARGYATDTFTAYTGTTLSIVGVGKLLTGSGGQRLVGASLDSGFDYATGVQISSTTSQASLYRAGVSIAAYGTLSVRTTSFCGVFDAVNGNIRRNEITASSASSGSFNFNRFLLGAYSAANPSTVQNGYTCEALAFFSALSTDDQKRIASDHAAYWTAA